MGEDFTPSRTDSDTVSTALLGVGILVAVFVGYNIGGWVSAVVGRYFYPQFVR